MYEYFECITACSHRIGNLNHYNFLGSMYSLVASECGFSEIYKNLVHKSETENLECNERVLQLQSYKPTY